MPHDTTAAVAAASAAIDPRDLRRAMGSFATGVTVVTTLDETGDGAGRPVGLTVNSFASVSLEPPLLLWSLARKSPQRETFRKAPVFAVNILAAEQGDICMRFAIPVVDRFAGIGWRRGQGGAPLIDGAVAQFECVVETVHPGGDHDIFIGRVAAYRWEQRAPLLFFAGALRALADAAA